MVIDMNESQLKTVVQLRAFLAGTSAVQFRPCAGDPERYGLVVAVLKHFAYRLLGHAEKGGVLRTTQYSRPQLTRLIRRALDTGRLAKRYRAPAQGFTRCFTPADVALLAATDALHSTVSGPRPTKHLMQRAWAVYGEVR